VTPNPAPLWRLLFAMIYDVFLVAPLLMANAFVWVSIFGPIESVEETAVPNWLMQLTSLAVIAVFFTIFWCKSGQTLGMQAWRIKVQTPSGNLLTPKRALGRCWASVLSFAPFGFGYLWSLIDRDSCTWHDRISDTRVILLPKTQ
jgi:uncharacterized RDD family membrane protein YckC